MARKRSGSNANKKVEEKPKDTLLPLRDKLERANQLAEWIDAARAHSEEFPSEVVKTVISDYRVQYDELLPQLRELAEGVATERATLAETAAELETAAQSIEKQVDEFKLRRLIGELNESDFNDKVAEAEGAHDASALPATREAIDGIDRLLSDVGAVQNRVSQALGTVPEAPAAAPEEPEAADASEAPADEPAAESAAEPEAPAEEPKADADAPAADELGEEAYRAGGEESSVPGEWDVEPPAAPESAPADAAAESVDPSTETASHTEDLMATGVIQAQPGLADAPPVHNTAEFSPKQPPAAPGEGPRLAVTPPGGEEVIYPFTGDVMSLGRGRNNDVQIKNDGKISRYHCRIFRRGDEFIVEDNKSSNGTLVDGKLVTRQRLDGGELVQLGETRVRFYIS